MELIIKGYGEKIIKVLGIFICVVGTIVAIIYPPVSLLGINLGWDFIWADQGFGTYTYNFINAGYLAIEIIVINAIGLGLFFWGRKRQS